MKCPKCVAEGSKSQVRVLNSSTTCLAGDQYYDEEGRHHWHDPNTTFTEYRCSLGHNFAERTKHRTCWCESIDEADVQFKEAVPAEFVALNTPSRFDEEAPPAHKVEVKRHAPATSITDSFDALFGHPTE